MQHLFIFILPTLVMIILTVHSAPSLNSMNNHHRLSPDEYRSISYDQDDDDDYYYIDELQENICEQAMNIILQHHDISNLNPSIVLDHCPNYEQRLISIQQQHHNQTKQESKRKQFDSSILIDYNKRRALQRRELNKQIALRFIRKRMS